MKLRPIAVVGILSGVPVAVATLILLVLCSLAPKLASRVVRLEENPFALSERFVVKERSKGAAVNLVEQLRSRDPHGVFRVEKLPDGSAVVTRIGVGGRHELLKAVGKSPELALVSGRSERAFVSLLGPCLDQPETARTDAQDVARLAKALLCYAARPEQSVRGRVLQRVVQLGVLGLFSLTALGFLIAGTFLLRREPGKLAWKPFPALTLLGAGGGAVCMGLAALLGWLLGGLGFSVNERPLVALILSDPATALLAVVPVVLLAPLAEEIFFRGWAFRFLLAREPRWIAYGVSAVAFAGVHLNPAGFPVYLAYGLVFAWLTERTGSIVPSVAAHLLVNAVALVGHLVG